MLPEELKKSVESLLSIKTGSEVQITDTKALGGGSINEAFSLKTTSGKFFIKYNSATTFPFMFENAEKRLSCYLSTSKVAVRTIISGMISEQN